MPLSSAERHAVVRELARQYRRARKRERTQIINQIKLCADTIAPMPPVRSAPPPPSGPPRRGRGGGASRPTVQRRKPHSSRVGRS
ncbi:MAG: hypothetical protein OWU84_01340 [Firmicutes bacterium]|nr:hypothetical protein [Bacillota bacterium]